MIDAVFTVSSLQTIATIVFHRQFPPLWWLMRWLNIDATSQSTTYFYSVYSLTLCSYVENDEFTKFGPLFSGIFGHCGKSTIGATFATLRCTVGFVYIMGRGYGRPLGGTEGHGKGTVCRPVGHPPYRPPLSKAASSGSVDTVKETGRLSRKPHTWAIDLWYSIYSPNL